MAAECMEEDLLGEDAYSKEFGELEDLDDDAENALLGDSDDEGSGKQRNATMTTNNKQQYGEEEYEYVDEDGNVVDIRDNENFEYIEISQDNNTPHGVDDSGNDDVLDLVVDPDLEFDDSVAQDSQNDELQSDTPEKQNKQEQIHPKHRFGTLHHAKQASNFQQDRFDRHRKTQQDSPVNTYNKSQEHLSYSKIPSVSSQSPRDKSNQKVVLYNNSCDTDDGSYEQNETFDSKLESSESEEEENSGRGRFRTERSNIIQLTNAKKRSNIPDSLDLVISHEEVSRLERSSRHPKRYDYGKSPLKDQDRHKEKIKPKDKDRGRDKEHRNDSNFKDVANSSQRPSTLLNTITGFLPSSNSISSGHANVISSVNQEEAKGPRKILINPHFKGGVTSSSGVPSSALWDNKPVHTSFPHEQHHNSLNNLFPPSQSHQTPHPNTFNTSFGSAVHRMPSQVPMSDVPPPQFQYSQPSVKPNTEFQNFQRPPSLMSIPSHVTLPNNLNNNNNNSLIGPPPVPLFPPPRDHPPPSILFGDNRSLDMMPVQYQDHSSSSHWNQHQPPAIPTFKPFNASSGPVPLNFPSSQPPLFNNPPQPSNFSPVQRSQLPIFRAQLAPQNIRLPAPHGPFTTPPPNFNLNNRMEIPPLRPMDRNWQGQQTRPRMAVPMPPNFREPPPPIGVVNHPSNLPFPNPSVQFNRNLVNVHGISQENKNMQPPNQFSPIRVHTLPPYKQIDEDNNFRQTGLKQNQRKSSTWTDKNVQPVKVSVLPRKRVSEDGSSMASPIKQARLSVKLLSSNRRKPIQVNTNIKQVEIVDQLPVVKVPTSVNIDVTAKDVKSNDQNEAQKVISEGVLKNEEDEDEETKQYRQKIELQKKKREEIVRLKEQRRIIMAHQRRKQMLTSQQQQQQHPSPDIVPKESLIPLITGISTPLVKPVTPVATKTSIIGKKRIVVRRVPCRGYHALRKNPNPYSEKTELSSISTVNLKPVIDHVSSSNFPEGNIESDESTVKKGHNASTVSLELKNVEQSIQQKPPMNKRIVRRVPKTIHDNDQQEQDSLQTVRTLTPGHKIGQRTITAANADGDHNHARVQIKSVLGGNTAKLSGGKKMINSGPQPGSLNKTLTTINQRQITFPDQGPRRVFNPNNATVRIENLSVSTEDVQLRKLCQSVGPVESISVCKEKRTANIKFKHVQHAKQFLDKYQRKIVDLSLITITLVS